METQTGDGTLPHGSFEVTMLETGRVFIADNFSFDNNSKKLQSMSARGKVRRQKVISTDISGSCDFQFEDEDIPLPEHRETFAVDADQDGNAEPYMVEKAGRSYQSDGEFKSKITHFAMANPLPYRTPASLLTTDLTISPIAVSGANAGDVFTAVAHGLSNGDRVTIAVTAGLTGITHLTDYYVINKTADTFQVSAIAGGSAVVISADGTGYVQKGVDFAAYLPKGATAAASPFSATGLPTGLSIDPATGKISGKATAGAYPTVTIKHTATRIVDGVTETLVGVRKFAWMVS